MGEWRNEVRDGLENLVDRAVTSGARQQDVFAEVAKVIEELRIANERDPDPADTPLETVVDEPANDWPGAER